MPSGHSAAVASLTTAIYIHEGYSTLFVVALVFTAIVINDAFGVRLETEKQARMLNLMGHLGRKKKLKEDVGHTKVEVAAGLVLGITVALITSLF